MGKLLTKIYVLGASVLIVTLIPFSARGETNPSLVGTWNVVAYDCEGGKLSSAGERSNSTFRSGLSIQKLTIDKKSRAHVLVTLYSDRKDKSSFCQIRAEEDFDWTYSEIQIKNTVITKEKFGNYPYNCKGDDKRPESRTQRYTISENRLREQLVSGGKLVNEGSKMDVCSTGIPTLVYEREK